MLFFIAIATFFSTLLGGFFALRLRDRLHLILGFSAGAVIGVAFFDLMPEALELAGADYSVPLITSIMALGFLAYMVLDRLIFLHGHGGGDAHIHRGAFGAASLSFHSFIDGAGIGLAFKVSPEVGLIVAAAVLMHNFSDGINTVGIVLRNKGERTHALLWLCLDAIAPVLGILSTLFFTIEGATLGLLLALFSGSFFYIGASDLLPESHHAHPVRLTTIMTVLGMAVIYLAVNLAGI